MKKIKGLHYPISRVARRRFSFAEAFSFTSGKGKAQQLSRILAANINNHIKQNAPSEITVKASYIYSLGLMHTIFKTIIHEYRKSVDSSSSDSSDSSNFLKKKLKTKRIDENFQEFIIQFPVSKVYKKEISEKEYHTELQKSNSEDVLITDMLLVWVLNRNPVFKPYRSLFSENYLQEKAEFELIVTNLYHFCETVKGKNLFADNMVDLLLEPSRKYPDSLIDQLKFLKEKYRSILGDLLKDLLLSFDLIKEEEKIFFPGPGTIHELDYSGIPDEERFSTDLFWMPRVILIAKNALVWMDQLSKQYSQEIKTLDQIPEEEFQTLSRRGFTSLWLIGLWERSEASKQIKISCGNPEAAASAYSLYDYQIAEEIGGWQALHTLRDKAEKHGIKLASDMVPNHTGIVSDWVYNHPERYIQSSHPPFPEYSYESQNLSQHSDIGIYLEDHYYQQSDAAVTFKRVDFRNGETTYMYHGNDGTHMPWNDTAQLDFLNPETREAVIQTILHVAANFQIIRFDAAMTLAKKHIQRLWFPEPGHGGDIPSRSDFSLSNREFHKRIPREFWKDVVDRIHKELPNTLLIAEAFWMMEGYFVRNLGMHRVYNSAFMHMMKNEDNEKYKHTIKNTLEYDPQILKRFVNFMNNPDEETALEQFGNGDKYIGVCTAMITMPGLPMFGHGQVEGLSEKYGMEYRKAYKDEYPNGELITRHENEIFPLMKKRYLFAEVENFLLFDLNSANGINHNVFAYSNKFDDEKALVFFNNNYYSAKGTINHSTGFLNKESGSMESSTLASSFFISNEPAAFCIFKEVKSGISYIQRSSFLNDTGFYTELNGYETKIFMDFKVVKDDDQNSYETLFNMFGNSGLKDLNRELDIIRLKPLYQNLEKIILECADKNSFKEMCSFMISKIPELISLYKQNKNTSQKIEEKITSFAGVFTNLLESEYLKNPVADYLQRGFSLYSDAMKILPVLLFINISAELCSEETQSFFNSHLLDEFLQQTVLKLEINTLNYKKLPQLFSSAFHLTKALNKNSAQEFNTVLSSDSFAGFIEVHEYEETVWYKGDQFDLLLFWISVCTIFEQNFNSSLEFTPETLLEFLDNANKKRYQSEYKYNTLLNLIKT